MSLSSYFVLSTWASAEATLLSLSEFQQAPAVVNLFNLVDRGVESYLARHAYRAHWQDEELLA